MPAFKIVKTNPIAVEVNSLRPNEERLKYEISLDVHRNTLVRIIESSGRLNFVEVSIFKVV